MYEGTLKEAPNMRVSSSSEGLTGGANNNVSNNITDVNSFGYHYGAPELDYNKKSETLGTKMGSLRDTGAFGTGTYYVGNPDPNLYHSKGTSREKTEHKINTNGYNQFRPQSAKDGFALHEFLRSVDNKYDPSVGFNSEEELQNFKEYEQLYVIWVYDTIFSV